MVSGRQRAVSVQQLIAETRRKEEIEPGRLTIHAGRGSSLESKPEAVLLAELGVTHTDTRPHVSDDNPDSESQFKTLKYCPAFPDRFDSIEDARAFCLDFFTWYNQEHRHGGIGLMTPAMVHNGVVSGMRDARREVLRPALNRNPERFVRGRPSPPEPSPAAWINKPEADTKESKAGVVPENTPIQGIAAYGSEGDRQSWGNLEDDFRHSTTQLPGNDDKLPLRVSHDH
ncbi:MAG: transposase family protein [Acidobacteria bacterium]|nr:transposase family protein [Acidobacteriota bacterium]